jgi:uncharacterized protein (DUF1684 family)
MGRALILFWIALSAFSATGYVDSIEAWRKDREDRLKAPDGWLAVAGLFWLKEGENRAGSHPSYEIALPAGRSPNRIGVFDLKNGKVSFRVASGAHVTVNGKPVLTADLKPDKDGKPDMLQTSDFTMFVIERGGRLAIRMRDTQSRMRKEFTGLRWLPIREHYRVTAKWTAYDQPRKIAIPNILGQTEQLPSPGFATFTLNGQTLRLEPVLEGDQLFFIFRDQTALKTTYGAGRFLYSALPKDGKVVLDFNKAYNPPCAFTPYATCPLPPKQNRLAVKIEAGELRYGDH